MKLKYIFTSLIAALGLMAISCTEEADTFLKEVQVSSSYVAFPAEGGNVEITVNAQGDWAIEGAPDWLTVNPASGQAGEATVKFSAGAATETREASVSLNCLNKSQTIKVIQMTEKVEPATLSVKDALDIIKPLESGAVAPGTYRVKGIVCKITEISPSYGNATYYLSDDGSYSGKDKNDCNWIQVYRGLWLNGSNFTSGDEFAIGDELVIEGQLMDYKGTPETKEKAAFVVSISKSLIGVGSVELLGGEEPVASTEFPLEGGDIKVTLKVKGNGFHVDIPAAAKSWLHIEDFGSDYVTLHADANTGGDRDVEVGFSTEKDGKTYNCSQVLTQKGAILEVSIAEFLAAEVGDTQYRLTGLIISEYAADKQGQSFTIRDWSGEVLVYRLNDYKASGAKVDDIITVVGKRGAYGETKQMVSGVYESHIPVTTVTIADFITKPDDKPADNHVGTYYKVTGTITSLKNNKGQDNDYGNLYISDGTNEIYLYGLYAGWGASGDARKGFVKAQGIEVGDVLTSIGYKDTYSGLIELCGGIYVSHEKGQSGGDTFDYTPSAEYSASTNLWKQVDDANAAKFFRYFNPGWAEIPVIGDTEAASFDGLTKTNSTYEIKFEPYTDARWQNQFYIFPGAEANFVALNPAKTYNLKLSLTSTGTFPAFMKFSAYIDAGPKHEGAAIWEPDKSGDPDPTNIHFTAGQTVVMEKTGITGVEAKNVVFVFDFGCNPANTTVYIKDIILTEEGAAADNGKTVTEAIALADNSQVELKESLVVGLTKKGAVVSDGTNAIYAYGNSAAALAIGDKVTMKAKKTTFNGVPELTDLTDVTKVSGGNTVTYPTAKDITAEVTTYTASVAEFISFTGKLSVSGNYYNVIFDGVTARQGSLSQPIDALNAASLNGKDVIVTGYYNGLSSGKYLNVVATDIKEVPAAASFVIDGNFDEWKDVEGVAGRTDAPYDGIVALKAGLDADNLYVYMEVKKASLTLGGDAQYYNLCNLYVSNGDDEGSSAWMWTTKYDAHIDVWTVTAGVPALSCWATGFNGKTDASGDIVKYEFSISRSHKPCMAAETVYLATEINLQYVDSESQWKGEHTQVGFAPTTGGAMLAVTL
ncbi:MAG: hypothetical protein K6A64_00900 [Bacteroidales bacterium]|nr:hypothetical protein [Bacteroidales bacterium]